MADSDLKQHLTKMLTEPNAHVTFDDVMDGFDSNLAGLKVGGVAHTPWQLLEHLRLAQWDILEFSRDANHKSPSWPDGYWPKNDAPSDSRAWTRSADRFRYDLAEMVSLVEAEDTDLFSPILHGDGQTLLREALLLAKHNSYHLGQLMTLKKALSDR